MSLKRQRLVALLFACSALIAACSSGAGAGSAGPSAVAPSGPSAAAPSAASSPSGAAAASAPASAAASVAPSAGSGPDLASMIPAMVGDVTMVVASTDPETYLKVNVGRHLTPVLEALGKTPGDVQVASATGATEEGSLFIDAVRIDGADATALFSALQHALDATPGTKASTATMGGKQVLTWSETSGTTAVYAKDDVLFYVKSSVDAWVEAAVASLP
jgi:hypothetical protein